MVDFIVIVIYISVYIGFVATTFYILSYVAGKKEDRELYTDDEMPTVTVIIPIYNEQDSVVPTLNSILGVYYDKKKLEIMVVDDGSTDRTLERTENYRKKGVKVYSKKHAGKGAALNYGIKRAKGEIIFTMDADTTVKPESMKNMVKYFKDREVMSVSPAIVLQEPETIWQRIQHVEYLLGIFLRKAFAALNAIHITPGAFSAYRKDFFKKYGGYDENNLTEDLDMTLRIQYKGYKIENASDAPAYTIGPRTFKQLLLQRRRWYAGLTKNMWNYRKLVAPEHGDLGTFVLPIAYISIFLALFITGYFFIKVFSEIKQELTLLQNINYDFGNLYTLNFYVVERSIFLFFSNPIIIFVIFFFIVSGFYLFYASKKLGKARGLFINLPLYIWLFAVLFAFWWIISLFYLLFNRKMKWK